MVVIFRPKPLSLTTKKQEELSNDARVEEVDANIHSLTVDPQTASLLVEYEHDVPKCTSIPSSDFVSERDDASAEPSYVIDDSELLNKAKRRISVTDLCAQTWCEAQLFYKITTGIRVETAATKRGHARHEQLEEECHDVIDVPVFSKEDNLGVRMVNTIVAITEILPKLGRAREVWFGTAISGDIVIRGVIDELQLTEDNSLVLKDTKTRASKSEPSIAQKRGSALQLSIYTVLIDRIKNTSCDHPLWDVFFKIYDVDRYAPFQTPYLYDYNNLEHTLEHYLLAISSLPICASYACVEYDCNGETFHTDKVPINIPNTLFSMDYYLDFWFKERSLRRLSTEEVFKCKMCHFLQDCEYTPMETEDIKDLLTIRALEEIIQ